MCLGEEIGKLLRRGNVRKGKSASKKVVLNKVKHNLKMLGPLVKNQITGNLDGTLVITIKRGRSRNRNTKVHQELTKPYNLLGSRSHSTILSFSSRKSNSLLLLALLGNKRIIKKYAETSDRPPIRRVTCPVSIRVGSKLYR